jgi:hypothetical protein
MGYHSTSTGTTWGDTPAEILSEAFYKISKDFSEYLGQKLTREDLIIGCFCAIEDHFPPRRPKKKGYRNLEKIVEEKNFMIAEMGQHIKNGEKEE